MTRRQPTDIVQLKLRLREDLRRKLEREAARTKRSVNAEIAHRLEMSLGTDREKELDLRVSTIELRLGIKNPQAASGG